MPPLSRPSAQMAVTGALAHPNIVTTFKCHIRQLPSASPPAPSSMPPSSSTAAAHRTCVPPSAGSGGGREKGVDRDSSHGRFCGDTLPSLPNEPPGGHGCFSPLGQAGLLSGQDGGPEWLALGDAGLVSKSQSQLHQQQGTPCELRIIMELCEGK